MIQTFTMNHPIYLISKKTVNKELSKVRKWLEANRLALIIGKTYFVIFHSPQNIPNNRVIIKFGRETLKLLYYGIFFPFISHGVQVWGLTYPTYLNKVFILQKKIIKCMTFNDIMVPSSPSFTSWNF